MNEEKLKLSIVGTLGEDKCEKQEILAALIKDSIVIAEHLEINALPICFEEIEEDSILELTYPAHIVIKNT